MLEGILASRTSFPLIYFGLSLPIRSLKRVDFLHLEDKCARKLPTWNGKLVTTAGHVKSVIASQAIYHLASGAIKFIW
jgi:hypothetical protein